MSDKIYAVVGSFAMKPGSRKGIHVFSYEPEQGDFSHVGDFAPEINAGQGTYDAKNQVHYITDERVGPEGQKGGGGRILAFVLDRETGQPQWLNDKMTCATLPSYLCLDATGKYLLVPHHGAGNVVTKTVKKEDGSYGVWTDSDDGTLAVFPVEENGKIGDLCDVCFHEIQRENDQIVKIPHLHSCLQSPDGKLFLVCDKGLDAIHGYHLDTETGRLNHISQTFVEDGAHPRYGAFHPTKPVFYQNCENSVFLHVWGYDSESGSLNHLQKVSLLEDEEAAAAWKEESCADVVVTPDGRYVYVSIRGLNRLSALAVREDGTLALIQDIDCGGKNPRGLCLAPDSRYLFSLNRDTNGIARFAIESNGSLTAAGTTECMLPGNMRFEIVK